MSESDKSSDMVFEKYYPQHPLPNEITKLSTKETICQFCGISYLIHSEIKRLEEEIILLNNKIKHYEELKVSETKYEIQYNEKCSEIERLMMDYSMLNDTFIQLKSDRDHYQKELSDKNDTQTRLEASLSILKMDRDKFINTQNIFIRHIFELQKKIRNVKEEYAHSKREITALLNNNQSENSVFISKIRTTIEQIETCRVLECQQYKNEMKKLSLDLSKVQKENEKEIAEYTTKGQDIAEKNKVLIQENSELESQLYDMNSKVSQRDDIIRMLRLDIEELSASKNKHSNEIDDELIMLKSENKKFLNSFEEMENTNKKLQASLHDEQSEVQRLLRMLQEDNVQLNEYRDVITLKESQIQKFLQDIESISKDSEMQLSFHKAEISKLINEIKAKEKNAEVIKHELEKSYRRKLSEKDQEIKQLCSHDKMQQKIINESITEKEKLQKNFNESENEKQCLLQKLMELQSLLDLEKLSISKKTEDEVKSIEALENEIEVKENLFDKMENDLINKNNEITSLKQMVHKECEERYELTEALNQARQQLLLIGDFHIPKTPSTLPPIKSNTSSASDKCSSTISLKEKRNSLEKVNANYKNSVISTKRKLEKLFNP